MYFSLPSTKSSIFKLLNPAITARRLMERVLSSEFSYIYKTNPISTFYVNKRSKFSYHVKAVKTELSSIKAD